ncbi:two component system sensor kinase SsrB [Serratia proteamaculans]|uniref:response regulator transcription factor n=1 Tax=Serratia proteamaculans TaxID=28151 RepID=UPI00217C838C|nr:helix-turn-helix domain-containing protein [Serratia proteamaculans]CAI1017540.1 two component system sensor kinase SsrB [Serratia proteamaculans]
MGELIKKVNVLIIDKDEYFMEGLRHVISVFYFNRGIAVKFINQPVSGFTADIVFQSIGYGVTVSVWKKLQQGMAPPLLFLIRDQRDIRLSHIFQSVRKSGMLYRHQSIDTVKRLLEEAVSVQQIKPPCSELEGTTQHLTLRESEVLRYLRQGKSQLETANVMSLKGKTVSTHKRSAMRKLNFKRNHELYHWLLQGGLSSMEGEI